MRLVKFLPALVSFAIVSTIFMPAFAQQAAQAPVQTARQALIEILTSKSDIAKHLTVEVQKEMQAKQKPGVGMAFGPAMLASMGSVGGSGAKFFDAGPILFSVTDPRTHERQEVRIDNDDLNADQDTLQLSIHQFRDEKEIDSFYQFVSQITVGLKKQENIWRLNEIGLTAKLPVGDPATFRTISRETQTPASHSGDDATGMYGLGAATGAPDIARMDIQTTLSLLALQEQLYASQHPDQGFTCSLSDLVPDPGQSAGFGLDPQIKTGISNGFRLNVTGCQGTPAGSYQITAEPLSPAAGNKAFCTDATHNIRQSDDSRASTCLSSGRVPANSTVLPQGHSELVVH